ncbi:transcriptional regulator [Fontibacillus sp. BL9]|uniref:transcriptional regulator n=1 Tax=Fontibacillus sp. BL9 TaxID=3389971 RepID=UPI0039792707
MNTAAPILKHLDDFIKKEDLNLRKLATLADINAGTLSAIFNKNKVFTVEHLDRITSVMNLPEGHFYTHYIEEYLSNSTPDWRRVRPFLYRCMELDKLDCIKKINDILMENLMYSPLLFETAEDFFQRGKKEASALLFESISSSEKHQHSERLAFCQYRLFLIRQGTDQEQNYQAAIQFELYVDRLDEIDQLDALKDLANTYRAFYKWDKVDKLAQALEYKGKVQYYWAHHSEEKDNRKKPGRPLFFYSAYAKLLRACVSEARRNYEEALNYTYAYLELDWVKESDPDTIHWIEILKEWAQANIYAYKLLSGDVGILPQYLEYIKPKKDEILPALFNIVDAANRFNLNVDDALLQFSAYINDYIEQPQTIGSYTNQLIANAFADFSHELAYYYFNRNRYLDGFKYVLVSLGLSSKINKRSSIIKAVGLFERYRNLASSETMTTYQNLVSEVYEDEKEKTALLFGN